MSEEKPNFKITDRRLFNADGTPREGAREEAEAATQTPSSAAPDNTSGAETAASPPTTESTPTGADRDSGRGDSAAADSGMHETEAGALRSDAGTSAPDDDDPQEFLMVVEFIASFAAEALGMSAHPMAAASPQINLPLAKQCIDMLGVLQKKTRGNLNAEEKQFFELILSQLRMQYVSLSNPRAGGGGRGPRGGFTGHDITGGR